MEVKVESIKVTVTTEVEELYWYGEYLGKKFGHSEVTLFELNGNICASGMCGRGS